MVLSQDYQEPGSPAIDGGRGLKRKHKDGWRAEVQDRPPSMAGAD